MIVPLEVPNLIIILPVPRWIGSLKVTTIFALMGVSVAASIGLKDKAEGGVISAPPTEMAHTLYAPVPVA